MENLHDQAFDHLSDSLFNPDEKEQNQESFNKKRLKNWENALRYRPQFLPIQVVLPPGASNLPVPGYTQDLRYDVIINGAITDGVDRQVNFRRSNDSDAPFISIGDKTTTHISLDALAGKSLDATGKNGIQPLHPFLHRAGKPLLLEVYKQDITADPLTVSTCFCGYRVFSKAFVSELFSDAIREQILDQFEKYVTPEPRFALCPVVWEAGKTETQTETPSSNEPRFMYGFRTTVKDALINIGFDIENVFSREFFPIWALAAEAGNNTENYRLLKKPIPVAPGEKLYVTLQKTINGVNYAQDGQIEVLMSTV